MKTSFIGAGNMGGAILRGALEAGTLKATEVTVFGINEEKLEALCKELGTKPALNIAEAVTETDVVFLGFKPQVFEIALTEVEAGYTSNKIVVSMAAGISIRFIEGFLGEDAKIIRIMPNTPAQVGEAMTAVCRNANVSDEEFSRVFAIFEGIGTAEEVPEELIHCVIGVSGSSPAYTYMYINALAEAAVKNGMGKEQALRFAAQSVLGAAKMVLETGIDPEQLRINVCSPGGTTIQAVEKIQSLGFDSIVEAGFQAAVDKSKLMSK